jgi:hypothetical protein
VTDETPTPTTPAAAAVASPPIQVAGESGLSASAATQNYAGGAGPQVASDRPEMIVAGAFAAGFVIAMILKRLGH